MSNIMSMIEEADKLLEDYKATAERIAEVIADTIFEAIGLKLDWSLGWEEAGVDAICFQFRDKDMRQLEELENYYDVEYV